MRHGIAFGFMVLAMCFAFVLARESRADSWDAQGGPVLAQAVPEGGETAPSGRGLLVPPPLFAEGKVFLPTTVNPKDKTVMVLINAGSAPARSAAGRAEYRGDEGRPASPENTRAFYMDLNEITAEKFKAFDPKYDEKPYTGNKPCPNCPAMGIDWASANRYCLWAGKRLPSEAEWEAAASGPAANDPWPWGDRFLPGRANLLGEEDGHASVAPAGSFPMGASLYGVLDMIGNVWEWVETPYASSQSPQSAEIDPDKTLRIAKGGGWSSSSMAAKIPFRNIVDPALKNPTFGFRCMRSLE
ncbi:MAG: formylglycine-generating enzyme family protein [Nitrospinae bacterium]|nr:formylglycine-generating enzyme family protein [Nitrospinota bacterium]